MYSPTYEYDHVLDGLEELSIRDLQDRLWIHPDEEYMSLPDEAISYVFDTALGALLRSQSPEDEEHEFITQARVLRSYMDRLMRYDNYDTLLDSDLMVEIRAEALKLRKMMIRMGRAEYNRIFPTGQAGPVPYGDSQ